MWPVLSLLFAATFWGVVWFPLRLLEEAGLSGAWQMLVSYGAAIVTLLLVRRPPLSGLGRHPLKLAVLAVSAGWTNVGFVLAMLDGTVARALLLFYLSPVWTVFLGRVLLGERLSRVTLLTLPVGLSGILLMIWEPAVGSIWPLNRPDAIALSAGFSFAVTNVFTRDLKELGVRQKTMTSWVGVVVVAILTLFYLSDSFPAASAAAWSGSVALGVGGFFITTLAVVYGVSHMPVQRSAVILLFEIFIGAITAWWLAGETMDSREWLGGFLIMAAGFVAATRGKYE